ncbi:MAG TPA: hydantoinase/oxoprolinase family protein [Acetobacteraceae bacterium]|nr:hydantoinase/oxoprolinase family protein [Acetobacteraceae bacterium]
MTYTIGIDVGGTFTDIVVATSDGRTVTAKAASTPRDQSEGVLAALALAADTIGLTTQAMLSGASRIVHGTTVATNALLEGKAARVGMLTTEGHRDIIEMREGLKPDRYNLRMVPPDPLVPRQLRLPVRERIRADGSIATPLDAASLDAALHRLAAAGVAAVAVCFLHAWRNPAHEHAAASAVRARLQHAYVTASSDVLPQIKEFERFSTTVANAAVGPVIRNYLERLGERLGQAGFRGELLVILSHGGVASVPEAIRLAAGTALSGPAGGVAAAVALARAGVARDLIAFDMGGTSTDIALVRNGEPTLAAGKTVADARIALPGLDIVTLGAGGGSIGRVDRAGLLAVGPESAGADPGPACYGQGGTAATVTDANLVLGYLDPANFLGGQRRLDTAAATAAVQAVARTLGLSVEQAAFGIHRLVNTRMADGVRVATVRRGVDPRGFTLLAFGGAAGLHVASVAAELGIGRVVVPVAASVLSAWGMLNTDLRIELMRSQQQTGGIDVVALRAAFAAMEQEGRRRLAWFDGEVSVRRSADMRYGEQVFEIAVDLAAMDWQAPDLAKRIEAAFHRAHEALYTYALPDQDVVLVNARVSVTGRLPAAAVAAARSEVEPAEAKGHRRVWLDGWCRVPVFDFAMLGAGQALPGPCIVESATTTVLLRAGDHGRMDGGGWLQLTV